MLREHLKVGVFTQRMSHDLEFLILYYTVSFTLTEDIHFFLAFFLAFFFGALPPS